VPGNADIPAQLLSLLKIARQENWQLDGRVWLDQYNKTQIDMNKTSTYSSGILACMAGGLVSCNTSEVEDFRQPYVSPVTVNAAPIAEAPKANNETIVVSWRVDLSAPVQQAFEVGVELHTDTVQALVDNGTLENTVVLDG